MSRNSPFNPSLSAQGIQNGCPSTSCATVGPTQQCRAAQFIYSVQEVINSKRSKAVDRINILPQDPTSPGYKAPLPPFTDWLLPPPPQHSAHIVTTWGTDPHIRQCVSVRDRERWRDRVGERRCGVFMCFVGACITLESWGNIQAAFKARKWLCCYVVQAHSSLKRLSLC